MEKQVSAGGNSSGLPLLRAYFSLSCLLYSVLAVYSESLNALPFAGLLLLPLAYEWEPLRSRLMRSLPASTGTLLLVLALKTLCAIFASVRLPGAVFRYFSARLVGGVLLLLVQWPGKAGWTWLLAGTSVFALICGCAVAGVGVGTFLGLGECMAVASLMQCSEKMKRSEEVERQRPVKEFLKSFPESIMVLAGNNSVFFKNEEGFVLFDKTKKYHGGSFDKFATGLQEMNRTGTSLHQNIGQFRKDIEATYQPKMQWAQDYYFEEEAQTSATTSSNIVPVPAKERYFINVTMSWMAAPVYNPEDAGEIVLVFKDISDRDALREQKLADNMKTLLISTMSHELRTPLNGVIGILNMICDKLPPGIRGWWNAAHISAQLLLNTVNCMLDFSQLEMRKFIPHMGSINIRELFTELMELFEEIVPKKKVVLTKKVTDEVPVVFRSDPARVRQIAMNLLSNAANYTFSGSIAVSISMDSKEVMRIEVRDTGVGISKDRQTTLFRLFGSVDAETSTAAAKMAGLGLTVSNKLVQQLGGTLSVQSTQNVGSNFSFTLKEFSPKPDSESEIAKGKISLHNCVREERPRFRNTSDHEIKFRFDCKPEQRRNTMRCFLLKRSVTLVGNEPRLDLDLGLNENQETMLPEARDGEESDSGDDDDDNDSGSDSAGGEVGEELNLSRDILDSVRIIHRSVNRSDFSFEIGMRKSKAMSEDLSEIRKCHSRPCDVQVLVVDDGAINRLVLVGMLRNLGYFPKEACNGKEACDSVLAVGNRFDMILMDVQMPLMDGIEATYKIRQVFSRDELPIVGVTALTSELELQKCIDAGMNDTMTKPLSLQDVRATMQRYGLLFPKRMSQMTF